MDTRVPHLARAFTYSVPERLSERVRAGVRVRVRLAGQLVEGYVLAGVPDEQEYSGRLTPVDSVVSDIPLLTEPVLALCEQVAHHYAGSTSDVLRLAIPPRVAGAETGWQAEDPAPVAAPPPGGGLGEHPFVRSAAQGRPVRACWAAPAGPDWAHELAAAATAVAAAGRGALLVVPDGRDLAALVTAVRQVAGESAVAVLRSDDPPRERYSQFLAVLSGRARIVVGTRAACFAPLRDIGLVVLWDDGDGSLAEQRAPYPHAREVLAMRAHLASCAFLLAGFARSPQGQQWVESDWLKELDDPRLLRERRPQVFATTDRVRSPFDLARRLPQSAVAALRTGLADGPVLVQVPRTGYLPLTACQECRELAQCPQCEGPLAVAVDGAVSCRRCAWKGTFRCPHCGHDRLRAVRVGARRTAEELGRMFPGVPVVQSAGEHPVASVPARPAVVVSTPGVEPLAAGGYAAGALLDAQEELWRVGVRAREDAVRRWFTAAALLRPGAPLAITADSDDPAVQALIRWDPALAARAELAARESAALPPAQHVIQVDGPQQELEAIVAQVPDVTVLGPRELTPATARMLLRSEDFPGLRDRLRTVVLTRSTSHAAAPVRVQVDPLDVD